MECQPCCICDTKLTVEGEGPRDIFCVQCRIKARDPEFVQRVLEGLPSVKPDFTNARRQAGQLRRRKEDAEFACSLCDFHTNGRAGPLALIAKLVAAQELSDARARLERYHRWQILNAATLSKEDQRLLSPPGVPWPSPSTAQPIGRTRGDQAEYDLRLGPSPAPRKK